MAKPKIIADVEKLDLQLIEKSYQIGLNIMDYGGCYDGITPNDTAIISIKSSALLNNKLYFPQNSNRNAIYYFTNTPNLDGYIICCDAGVILSFPTTNSISFKNVIFANDINITSRDRNNVGKQLANYNMTNAITTSMENDINVGLKKLTNLTDSDIIKLAYFTTGVPVQDISNGAVAGGLYYNSDEDLYQIQNPSSLSTYAGKIFSTTFKYKNGEMFNCLFKFLQGEANNTTRIGIMATLDNGNFLFYSMDCELNFYNGICNNSVWTENKNIKYISLLTDAYNMKSSLIFSCRPVSNNTIEIYVNGVLIDTITTSFNFTKVGFGLNCIVDGTNGINNISFGEFTKGFVQYPNNGNTLKGFIVGDSITFGEGASISWANYLPTFCNGQRGINNINITNNAVSGETAEQQFNRLQSIDLSSYDFVLILIGTNDIQGQTNISTFRSTIQSIITLAKGNNRKVIIGIPPLYISQSITGQGFADVNYQAGGIYRNAIIKLCAENDIILADTMSEIGRIGSDSWIYTLRDNLHPQTFGQILLARCFARSLIFAFTNTPSVNLPIDVTLQNNWINFGNGYETAKVIKNNEGFVNCEGLIKNGVCDSGTILFTLPDGYRPNNNLIFPVESDNNGNIISGTIEVDSNGNVLISSLVGNTWLTLNAIRFNTI